VSAGVVDDAAEYSWSGHCEILGRVKALIVDVDELLRVFGTSRRSARSAYVRRFKGAVSESHVTACLTRWPAEPAAEWTTSPSETISKSWTG
jgi:hypothetical protein